MDSQGSRLPSTIIWRTMLNHPSEVVRCALVERHAARLRADAGARAAIESGATRESEKQGLMWTPLLDTMAATGVAERDWGGIASWASQQTNPEDIGGLVYFRHLPLLRRLALTCRLSPPQASVLSEHEGCRRHLFHNAHLADEVRDRLAERVVEDRGRTEQGSAEWRRATQLLTQVANSTRGIPPRLRAQLELCIEKDEPLPGAPENEAAELLAQDPSSTAEQILAHFPRCSTSVRQALVYRSELRTVGGVRTMLAAGPVRTLLESLLESHGLLPLAPDVLGYLLARGDLEITEAQAIARSPESASAEVLGAVRRTFSPVVAEAFIGKVDGPTFAHLFRVLVNSEPEVALMALEKMPAGSPLTPVDLAPLFMSENTDLQVRAFAAIHKVGGPAGPTAPPAPSGVRRV
jgi:hypothetical protein